MHPSAFRSILRAEGLHAAVRALNLETPHRFTAVFELRGQVLRNICLVDKLDPNVQPVGDQPIGDSYCVYVQRTSEPVSINDSPSDPRTEGHPKRDKYFSYYGVPLFSDERRVLGTVCHFDEQPIRVLEEVAVALDDVAPIIVKAAFPEQP